jgi:hypothetical protein
LSDGSYVSCVPLEARMVVYILSLERGGSKCTCLAKAVFGNVWKCSNVLGFGLVAEGFESMQNLEEQSFPHGLRMVSLQLATLVARETSSPAVFKYCCCFSNIHSKPCKHIQIFEG